jgi:hypothetical protein
MSANCSFFYARVYPSAPSLVWAVTLRLLPDHKTIADFRKDYGSPIKQVCVQFIELCRQVGLLSTASVAIEGSNFEQTATCQGVQARVAGHRRAPFRQQCNFG